MHARTSRGLIAAGLVSRSLEPCNRVPRWYPGERCQDVATGALSSTSRDRGVSQPPICGDLSMRMRGLEPPPGLPDTDLNRARLPIPPHPRGVRGEDIADVVGGVRLQRARHRSPDSASRSSIATCSGRFASLGRAACAPLSSRGLGRRPLMAETRVRIPVAVLDTPRSHGAFVVQRTGRDGRAPRLVRGGSPPSELP
jgi:hypothetical protein